MVTQAGCAADLSFNTLVETLCFRAEQQPDRIAYSFLQDGESSEVRLSNAQLDRGARAIGAWLQESGCAPGQPVLLLYPPGLDFIAAFFGCLYGGMIAVPTYPPHPVRAGRTLGRLQAILDAARPQAVLTTSELLPGVKALLSGESGTSVTSVVATDQLRAAAADPDAADPLMADLAGRWRPPAVDG